ncbi:MAG: hypothetical protein AAFY42_06885 [Pseudomonadota bacterium]
MSEASKKPTHIAYTTKPVGNGENPKTIWTRLGSVWSHQDGEGYTIRLDALPVNGEIVVRTARAEDQA